MTVKIYVSRDSSGKEWGPDYTHEMEGVIGLLQKLWQAYHHLPQAYAVVVNLRQPASADFVLITERGLGIIDLKHYPGTLRIDPDGYWYAGRVRVKGGVNQPTPPLQVHSYADSIRKRILRDLLPASLKSRPEEWDALKFQTAIVFTNPDANLSMIKEQVRQVRTPVWVDNFTVLAPHEIVEWATSLRFSLNYGREKNFEPYRLKPAQIESIITGAFGGTEWTEILPSMPTGEPYGFLYRQDASGETIYNLVHDSVTIGRHPDCDIIVPGECSRVSRQHCKIIRRLSSVEVYDMDSKHGTYIKGSLVSQSAPISHGQIISLGGTEIDGKNCNLRFELRGQAKLDTPATITSDPEGLNADVIS